MQKLLKGISPEFSESSLDFDDIAKYAQDPMVMAAMIFKLTKEKEQTNKLLNEIHDKFDQIMFALKSNQASNSDNIPTTTFDILPVQDQKILDLVETKGMAEARDVMEVLQYKGLNAASQRLNKLYKEGHLKKVRSGKKVIFMAKS